MLRTNVDIIFIIFMSGSRQAEHKIMSRKIQTNLRTCPAGHKYYKSSDFPTCPVCASEKEPRDGFLSQISAPARRALEREGILDIEKLAKVTEKKLLSLHGMGPSTFPK